MTTTAEIDLVQFLPVAVIRPAPEASEPAAVLAGGGAEVHVREVLPGVLAELEIDAAEIRARAERRLGEMLRADPPKAKGSRGQLKGRKPSGAPKVEAPEKDAPSLSDLGIDWKLSARAQKAAVLAGGVDHKTVANHRPASPGELPHLPKREGRDGKQYPATQPKRTRTEEIIDGNTGKVLAGGGAEQAKERMLAGKAPDPSANLRQGDARDQAAKVLAGGVEVER